jgi:hypothetical protein
MKFGWSTDVPAPATQATLEYLFTLDPMWLSFKGMLEADSVIAVESKSTVIFAEAEDAMNKFLENDDQTVPDQRMNIASRQVMLANKMVKEPLLPRLGSGSSLNELSATISLFHLHERWQSSCLFHLTTLSITNAPS